MKQSAQYTFLSLILSLSSAYADDKAYFSTLEPKLRIELIAKAKVFKAESQNSDEKIDILSFLQKKCGFEYRRDNQGLPVRPQVLCTYAPRAADDEMNGMSAKFDCKFESQDESGKSKSRTLKVKYNPQNLEGGGYKEVPQAIMGTLLANALNFYSSTYCPADLICKDCPENPWALGKGTAKANLGAEVVFKNVAIEVKQKGFKVTDKKNINAKKPQGFSFANELNRYFIKSDENTMNQVRAEREALTLWMNFVVSGDADHHNNKLLCIKTRNDEDANSIPVCETSVATINDYGNSFGFTDDKTKLKLSKFMTTALRAGSEYFTTSGASGNASAAGQPISVLGRNLFVQHADNITDQQLMDIFNLAQVEKISDATTENWANAFRKKIQKIRELR